MAVEQKRDPAVEIAALAPGTVFHGVFEVVRCIKAGGMGAVYEVLQTSTRRHRALKVMLPSLVTDPEMRARFELEAKIAAGVESEHIVETMDAGIDQATGMPFIVMELLKGEELGALLKARKRLSPEDVVTYLYQAAIALDRTHAAGIIHRDLKPENVFLMRRAGSPAIAKLLDFGISKAIHENRDADLTMPGIVMGTPYYMAPEQARGDRGLDHRVDIWAAGVILYEALTGRRPFVARNYNALLVQILTSKHRPLSEIRPSINASIERIVDKALAKMREDRFQTALEFRETLRRVIDPEPPPQSLRSQQQAQAAQPTQPARMSFSSEPEDDETVVLSLTHKEVATLAAARNSAPMSNRQGAASYNFDKRSAPGVPNAPAPPRPPGSSLGDRKTMPMGPQDPPAAEQAERVAWLPPPPPSAEKKIPAAKETPLIGAVHFDNPLVTQRAAARLPERLNFDDDDGEDERTLVDPPSFSGDRTTLVRPFPPPSGKGR